MILYRFFAPESEYNTFYKFQKTVHKVTTLIQGAFFMSNSDTTGNPIINGKEFWQSKIFWVNVISILAIYVQSKTGYIIHPATQADILAGINVGLRFITHEAIL